MKKLSKLMCLLLAVGMLMGIASCSSDAGEGGGGSSGGTETVRISCGPLNGYQNVLYNSIADMMNKANPGKYSFAIEASTGSAENARLLAMDETDFGTMGMDMAGKAADHIDWQIDAPNVGTFALPIVVK